MTAISSVTQSPPVDVPAGTPKEAAVAPVQPAKAPAEPQPFVSPIVHIDAQTGLALTIIRDNTDGNEIAQYPSKQAVAEYDRAAKVQSPKS